MSKILCVIGAAIIGSIYLVISRVESVEYETRTGNFLIWVGSSAFASGYCVDSYNYTEQGFVEFTYLRNGKKITSPRENIVSIEEGCEYSVEVKGKEIKGIEENQ